MIRFQKVATLNLISKTLSLNFRVLAYQLIYHLVIPEKPLNTSNLIFDKSIQKYFKNYDKRRRSYKYDDIF